MEHGFHKPGDVGAPPATIPTPTSHCEMIVFSRLAKLMSQASVAEFPRLGSVICDE